MLSWRNMSRILVVCADEWSRQPSRTWDLSSKDRSNVERSRLLRFSFFSPLILSPLSLSRRFHPGRVRTVRCLSPVLLAQGWTTWGRVASMAPAANGRAALQTLISCRFRGPSRFYLSASESAPGSLLFSLRPFGSRRHSPCLFALALFLRFAWSCFWSSSLSEVSIGFCRSL